MTSTTLQQPKDGAAKPVRSKPVAAQPTGRGAPTEPALKVDPATQAAMERVEPAPGYALVRLVLAKQRETELSLPAGSTALLESAMLRLLALHRTDDSFAREYPEGGVVFASLEGLAPLLGTYVYLLPLDRIQGAWPTPGVAPGEPIGFQD